MQNVTRLQKVVRRWGRRRALRVAVGLVFDKLSSTFRRDAQENALYVQLEQKGYTVTDAEFGVLVQDARVALHCRRFNSDIAVFKQIFVDDEFGELFSRLRQRGVDVKHVIDAGGNIGASLVRFKQEFPDARIISIEPDSKNFEVMTRNATLNAVNAALLCKGLWRDSRRLYFDRSFRDGGDWSIALSEEVISDNYVDSVSMADIVKDFALPSIDLLKIDIEGAERVIFDGSGEGLEFLEITKSVAIEIHDEVGVRDVILDALSHHGFDVGTSGEYVIALKRNLS